MEVHKDSFAWMLNYVCSLTLNSIRFMLNLYDHNVPDDFLRPVVVILASPLALDLGARLGLGGRFLVQNHTLFIECWVPNSVPATSSHVMF